VSTVLGLIGLFAFIVSVIFLAAAITWLVVRLTPQREEPKASGS
jgi:hypothetical protein